MTKRCVNGHYYDGDKFAMCPHCGARDMDIAADKNVVSFGSRNIYSSSAREAEENKTVKLERPGLNFENAALFGSAAASGAQDDPDATVPIMRNRTSYAGSWNPTQQEAKAPEMPEPEFKAPEMPEPEFKAPETPEPEFKAPETTEPEFKTPETTEPEFKAPEMPEPVPEQSFRSTEPMGAVNSFVPPVPPPPVPSYQPPQFMYPQYQPPQPPQYQQQFNYSAAVQNAINNPVSHDDNPTVSLMREKFSTEPVVGWLVCVGGKHFGESFELRSGKNLIGRSAQMDVSLPDETDVAAYNHAAVIYEPREKCFYVQAGDSRELLYKNDEVLLKNERLSAYDVLTAGNAKLLFFPLCGEDFSWDKVKEEN